MFRDGKGKDLLPMKPKDCKYNTTEHKYSDINQIYSPYRLTNKGILKNPLRSRNELYNGFSIYWIEGLILPHPIST